MTNIQTKFNFKKIKTLKTKTFLGLVSLGLTLGALSTLGSQTLTQTFAKSTSNSTLNNNSVNYKNLSLRFLPSFTSLVIPHVVNVMNVISTAITFGVGVRIGTVIAEDKTSSDSNK